ncbi:Arc family DNA-binding protein [Oscillospiraceae bacterium MB08-C2-2]|nr:Arc family DNA-binding protein [Oscillospiraceae bacterium MB08-C2-2]
MPSNLPQFTLRISLSLLDKLRYIANQNSRSANKEMEMLIKNHIAEFEKEHGEIIVR